MNQNVHVVTESRCRVVILNWNRSDTTLASIAYLLSDGLVDASCITVVDNGSSEQEVAQLKHSLSSWPGVSTTFLPENQGFTGGNNVVLSQLEKQPSTCEFVLLLNDDALLSGASLVRLLEYADQNTTALCGPLVYGPTGSIQSSGLRYSLSTGIVGTDKQETSGERMALSGCCLLIRSASIPKIGVLDDRYMAYFEEIDYAHRTRILGLSVHLCAESTVQHLGGEASAKLSPFVTRLLARNRSLFALRHGTLLQKTTYHIFLIAYAPLQTLLLLTRGNTQAIPAFWNGLLAGLSEAHFTRKLLR